jgi:adhesin/invasin
VLTFGYEVSDLSGRITGNIGAVYTGIATAAVEDESIVFSVAASLGTSTTTTYSVDMLDGTANAASDPIIFTGGTAAAYATSNGTPSVALSAIGGTNTIKARVTNQFGGGVANHAVTASIAGRNALTTIAGALVTDASGYVTFTYTDAGTAATVLTQDTITFTSTASNDATGTATVNFGSVTVGTVTVTGAASADVAPSVTYTNISTAAAGPHGSVVAITATVKDANGNVLAGVPVTFTLSGNAGSAIQKTAATDFTTVYTGTAGTAITNVIGWTNGKTTVTATAGGKTGTGTINFLSGTTTANSTAAARVLSGTVAADLLSYKVVDRFGNPVPGVSISLSRTGSGLFGGGTSTQTLTTDDNGTADAIFTGEGTVKAKLATTYYQAYDVAGEVDATAVTAPTAGTTIGTG